MKKFVLLMAIALLATSMVASLASASIFDWITGKAADDNSTTGITEQVKCIFADSSEMQKCYADDGKFSCSGIGSCMAEVSGVSGTQLTWTSSCSMKYSTTIDNVNEEIKFSCPIPVTARALPPCGNGACESGETCSSCSADCGTCTTSEVSEQVKCTFLETNSYQKCYTSNGKYACSGIGSCVNTVLGAMGTKLEWASSCGSSYTYTYIDGKEEETLFKCPSTTATPAISTAEIIREQVTCIFADSTSYQKCYTEDGKFGCAGVGSCIAEVSGIFGAKLIWKSLCEGYESTIIDGNNAYVYFKCGQAITTTTSIQPASVVKEQVKCLFINSNTEQECHSSEGFKCSGVGSCVADVSGEVRGKQIMWKSSCGGYAYTIIDGNNGYAEFKCGEAVVEPVATAPVSLLKRAKIYVFTQTGCSYCDSEKNFIETLKQKYPNQIEVQYFDVNSSPQYVYTIIVATYLKKGVPLTFINDKVWNGFNDDIASNIESEAKLCIEQGCPSNPNPPIPEELKYYVSSYMTLAPKMTPAQIQTLEGNAKEQITCIFHNSDVLINPHTARPEKCVTDDGAFGCIWDGNVMTEEDGERKAYCVVMNVEGVIGKKLTWKSSCGGYAYSVIDGNNENVDFNCVPATNVTVEQISGKGFMNAYWQCYDSLEFKSAAANCKSSEVWQKEAQEFCGGHCKILEMDHPHKKCPLSLSRDMPVGKAVVNEKEYTFELISNPGNTSAMLKITNPDGATTQQKFELEAREKVFDALTIILGSSSPGRTDITIEGGDDYIDCMKCGVNSFSVSQECYLEAGGEGVVFMPVEETEAGEIKEESQIEEALICKDSCPLENKCYPFGYRKSGSYCSINNAFVSQLKGEEECDNSFECSSNVCVSSQCVSEGLMNKILNWFKKLFG